MRLCPELACDRACGALLVSSCSSQRLYGERLSGGHSEALASIVVNSGERVSVYRSADMLSMIETAVGRDRVYPMLAEWSPSSVFWY
jgi:hypothetical protein